MIYHIVLYKFSSSAATKAKIDSLYTAFKAFKDIPGVLSVDYGNSDLAPYKGYLIRNRDYTHCLIVTFKDFKALEYYDGDSLHQFVKNNMIKPLLNNTEKDNVLAVDFEENYNRKSWFYRLLPELSLKNSLVITSLVAAVTVGAVFAVGRKPALI
jgi:hypothetical protein